MLNQHKIIPILTNNMTEMYYLRVMPKNNKQYTIIWSTIVILKLIVLKLIFMCQTLSFRVVHIVYNELLPAKK